MSDRVKYSTRRRKRKSGFQGTPAWSTAVNNVDNVNKDSLVDIIEIDNDIHHSDTPPAVVVVCTPDPLQEVPTVSRKKVQPIHSVTPKKFKGITGYRFMDTEILSSIVSMLACPVCYFDSLALHKNIFKRNGLCSSLYIKCKKCQHKIDFTTSNNVGKRYDVNIRSAYAFRSFGQSHAGLEKFTAIMNMPRPMTSKNYNKVISSLLQNTREVAEETMKDAISEIKTKSPSSSGNGDEEISNIGISIDGAWTKRGFSSINCVVTAISLDNGKVVDVEPMARSCKMCNMKEPLKVSDPVAYTKWQDNHKCTYAYRGSAQGMEQAGTKTIFSRSIDKHSVRYTNLLGDGDTKSFSVVKDIYDGHPVYKSECVGHYQKRIGSRLRRLKKSTKGLGGKGKLTDAMIDRLQNYFGMAIRQNAGNLKEMQAATRASLFHCASSSKNNWHFPHCPTGSDSWCAFNRDKANGTTFHKPGPGLP